MRTLHFALPGSIERRTGGTIYDRRIVEGLRARDWSVVVYEMGGRYPIVDDEALSAAEAVLARAGRPLVIDGLALPAFRLAARPLAVGRGIVALVHHPLAEETGLAPAAAAMLRQAERADLGRVDGAIVTSAFTAGILARDFDVAPERIAAVVPGTLPPFQKRPQPRAGDRPVRLLSVAAVVPRKGHRLLLEALQRLRGLPWDLVCIGQTTRDRGLMESLIKFIVDNDLEDQVHFMGEVEDAVIVDCLATADLFVHAADFEGYGMALAEALKVGLPVVAVAGGAVPEVVPPTAGLLCPPGDAEALATALQRMIRDPSLRHRMASGAAAAGAALPNWATAAGRFAAALDRLVP